MTDWIDDRRDTAICAAVFVASIVSEAALGSFKLAPAVAGTESASGGILDADFF